VARALHRAYRRAGDFVAFNVCALSESMFEDALFGHVRGAFTGAVQATRGYLGEANEGTLFLDEVGALPVGLQAKLLRALETGVYRPIGSTADAQSNFRLVSATNQPLDAAVMAGHFRSDLHFRMSGLVVHVPPLADRVDDIPPLASHFLAGGGLSAGVIDRAGMRWLQGRAWPGNVRQLRHFVELAAALGGGRLSQSVFEEAASLYGPEPASAAGSVEESALIKRALSAAGGRIDAAAEALGVHRATLYRRMKSLGIVRYDASDGLPVARGAPQRGVAVR